MIGKKLLIIDDETTICETLKDIFEEKGFEVQIALNGHDAQHRMEDEIFDVAFIDIILPDVDGITLLHKFKSRFPEGVCVIITGHASLQNALVALKDGADGYFVKPLDINEVLLVIQQSLEKQILHKKIRESEEMYCIISENASDLICIIGRDDVVEYVNKIAHMKQLGLKTEDLKDKPYVSIIFQEDRERVESLLNNCRKVGKIEFETRIILFHSDNPYKWFEIKAQSFVDKQGDQKLLLLGRDITERKEYEKLLDKENIRLKELSDLQYKFVVAASHELRTPLTLICGGIDYIVKNLKEDLTSDTLKLINAIFRGSTRLRMLVESIVDFINVNSDIMLLNIQKRDLIEIIDLVLKELHDTIDRIKIKIILQSPEKIEFKFDEAYMRKVIFNLISNAVKNSKEGDSIKIEVGTNGDLVNFSIMDHGIGIMKEEKDVLFTEFGKIYRESTIFPTDIQGIGLGLYISKKIVEKHGGKIWVESEGRNKGSVFTFTLPFTN